MKTVGAGCYITLESFSVSFGCSKQRQNGFHSCKPSFPVITPTFSPFSPSKHTDPRQRSYSIRLPELTATLCVMGFH